MWFWIPSLVSPLMLQIYPYVLYVATSTTPLSLSRIKMQFTCNLWQWQQFTVYWYWTYKKSTHSHTDLNFLSTLTYIKILLHLFCVVLIMIYCKCSCHATCSLIYYTVPMYRRENSNYVQTNFSIQIRVISHVGVLVSECTVYVIGDSCCCSQTIIDSLFLIKFFDNKLFKLCKVLHQLIQFRFISVLSWQLTKSKVK